MKKVCIFDLDGTLTNTVESIAKPVNMTLKEFGLEERPVEEYKMYAGDGIDMTWRRALTADGGVLSEAEIKRGSRLCMERLQADPLYHVKPYPQITELLSLLKDYGIKTAVLSNKSQAAAVDVVEQIFGKDMFAVICGESETVPRKPDPKGALLTMERLQVKPEECLYMGDTNTDMKTGKAAGIFTVGVTWGFRDRQELEKNRADAVIDFPLEVIPYLEGER